MFFDLGTDRRWHLEGTITAMFAPTLLKLFLSCLRLLSGEMVADYLRMSSLALEELRMPMMCMEISSRTENTDLGHAISCQCLDIVDIFGFCTGRSFREFLSMRSVLREV